MREARQYWQPVWVVVDGSNDGTDKGLMKMAESDPGLKVFVLPHNQGKGSAILHGLRAAIEAGFTHALAMDADGQHPAGMIPQFMSLSQQNPDAEVVLGRPISTPARRPCGCADARSPTGGPTGDLVAGRGRFPVRISRLPGRTSS